MADRSVSPGAVYRVCKTRSFAKSARKARIGDGELCSAMRQVVLGQADDLGGGVFKQRLDKNRYRSIILARGTGFWIYEYLFAKKDRQNIEDDELIAVRKLAKIYQTISTPQIEALIRNKDWEEICHDSEEEVQE